MKNYYSPYTGELIHTEHPSDWMLSTDISPPTYDAQTQGCFWRDGSWVVEDGDKEGQDTPTPLDQIAALEASVTQRRLREATLGIDNGWLSGVEAQIRALREEIYSDEFSNE